MTKKRRKSRGRPPIDKCRIYHTRNRIQERYGISLTVKEIEEIGRLIRTGKSLFLDYQSKARSFHKVWYMDREFIVIYDKHNGVPITSLTKEMYDEYQSRQYKEVPAGDV